VPGVALRQVRPQPAGASGVVDCAVYCNGERSGGRLDPAGARDAARALPGGFAWIGLHEPSFAELSGLAAQYDLHPLAVEDAVHAHQRPKLERYGETLFVVLKTARYLEHTELTSMTEVIETGEVMLFLGPSFVITVRHGDARRLDGVRADLEANPALLALGPTAVLYAVADHVVDDYLAVTADLEDDVDEVETQVFSTTATTDVRRIYQLKRELLELKRAVAPLRRPVSALTAGAVRDVPDEIRTYFRDVEDHLTRVSEQIASFDELLTSILQANLAQVTVQQNNDMRKISAWVAIAAVPTATAGIYGMNFEHMPELEWRFGYPMVVSVMVTVCLLLYRGFRRTGWL